MLAKIKAILKSNGYILYTRPQELNIVGIRSASTAPNAFDDEIHVFYTVHDGKWNYHVFKCTTDPGTYWLNNPMAEQGTAILAQGQYVDTWIIGMHKGKYEALVQAKEVTVIRDYDRDAVLDFNNGTTQTGIFGINIHRANSVGTTMNIDKNSAGCQVFQNAGDFEAFLALCHEHKKRYGNKFTYTLVDFRAIRRITLRRVIAASTAVATALLGWAIFDDLMYEHT
jgi:hypothetical protein